MRRYKNYRYLKESKEGGWKLILNGNDDDVWNVASNNFNEDDYTDWDEYYEAVKEEVYDIIDPIYEKIESGVDAQLKSNGGIYVKCDLEEGGGDYTVDCLIEGGKCGYVDSFEEFMDEADINMWMCVYQNNQGYLVFEDNYACQWGSEDVAMLVILTEEGKRARKEGKSAEEVFNAPDCYKPSNLHMPPFEDVLNGRSLTESHYTKPAHKLNEGAKLKNVKIHQDKNTPTITTKTLIGRKENKRIMTKYTNRHNYQRRISEGVEDDAFDKNVEWMQKQNLKGQLINALISLDTAQSSDMDKIYEAHVEDYNERYNTRNGFGAYIHLTFYGPVSKLRGCDIEPVLANPLKKYFTDVDIMFMSDMIFDIRHGGMKEARTAYIDCSGFKGILGEKYAHRSRSSRRLHEGFTTSEKRTLQEGCKELLNAMSNTSMIEAIVEGAVVDKDIEKRDEIRSQCYVAYDALGELYDLLNIWGKANGLWD